MKRFDDYINGVTSGKIVTGELIKLAIKRHLDDLDKDWDFYFDRVKAQKAINFLEKLHHWKGEWSGLNLILEPHQVFYIGSLFGWLRKSDNQRRFRTSYKQVARKNGKTSECAGKSLYHLVADGESGAQVYFAATKEDQARIGFNDVREITKNTPGLRDMLTVYVKSVIYNNSFVKPLGSDSDTQDGFDPSWGVIDEYHAHKTDEMLNVLESGMGSRRQPVIDVITTAGFNKESPCYANLRRVCIDVLKGIKKDDSLFALIYELDEGDDWKDEKNWIKANPNLNVSVKMDFLQNRFVKAINEGGTKEVDFLTKNLNMWTDSAETWIPDDVWMKGNKPLPDLTGKECWIGLDLASTRDFTTLTLIFPGDTIYVKTNYYLPEKRGKEENDYRGWIKDGLITITPGDTTDYSFIYEDLKKYQKTYDIQKIAFDRWNSSDLVRQLTDENFPMAKYGQGYASMSAPAKELETIVYKGRVIHGGDPILRWMNANICLKRDPAGNIKPDKSESANKIDGMVSLIMALGEWMAREKKKTPNIRFL